MSRPKNRQLSTKDKLRAKTERAKQRIRIYLDVFHETLERYERENPNWRMQALLWLMETGLVTLRHGIESPQDTELSWENTILTYHYPVDWDWNRRRNSNGPQIAFGRISSTDSRETTAKKLGRMMVEAIIQTTLQEMTRRVAWEKRGDEHQMLLPEELVPALKQVRGARNRDEVLEELYRPFSMGVTDFAIDPTEFVHGQPLPKKAQRELHAAHRRMIPPITGQVDVNGHPMELILVFQAHPLEVDLVRRKAYYPITTGFVLHPKAGPGENVLELNEESWAQPANWSEVDRRDFWENLLGALRREGEKLGPAKPTPAEDALLTFTGKLRVRGGASEPNKALARLAKRLEQSGQVVELTHTWNIESDGTRALGDHLRRVHAATTPNDKGRSLESLVAALFARVPGFAVTTNQRTATEEIDLAVINSSEEARWRSSGPLILVECKNWSSRCDKNELVQFRDKVASRYGQCRLGFLVSWGGFAATVGTHALRYSQGDILIVTLTRQDLETACRTGEFLNVLRAAWDRAVTA